MKKIFALLMVVILILSMTSCRVEDQTSKKSSSVVNEEIDEAEKTEITDVVSVFMSGLTNLDFATASACLERPEMAECLTSQLADHVVTNYVDALSSSASWWLLESYPECYQQYKNIIQKPFDYIKENAHYEIGGVQKAGEVYEVYVELECIDIIKLLKRISAGASRHMSAEIVSDAAFYFTKDKSKDEYTEDELEKCKLEACLGVAEDNLTINNYGILSDCEKEKTNVVIKVVENEKGYEISSETDMNFVRLFIV